jgi:hypothetical protein
LVGYTIQGDQQSPVYATVSLTLDVGKSKGRSAYKKQNPDVKKVLRCYTSDRHFKNRVISNTAVDHSRLVKCLKPYGKGWPDKVKEDFAIEFPTFIQQFSDEKLNGVRADPSEGENSQDTEGASDMDIEEIKHDFFDTEKSMDQKALEQFAKVIQTTFKLNKAPSVELLEGMRVWAFETGLPEQSYHAWGSFFQSNSQSPPSQPRQSAPDDDLEHEYERRMNSVWDDLEALNTT